MRPLIATSWPYAILYCALFVWAYLPEFVLNRRSGKIESKQDAGSFRLVILMQGLAMVLAFFVAFWSRLGGLREQRLWFWIGLGVMVGGSLLRRHCFRMLGKSFTAVVVVSADQTIVNRGAYRWVRHPSYTAGAVMLAGQILALGNWISLVIVLCAIAVAYSYRVRVEERALLETLGEPYRDYMGRTKRFVPMII